MAMGPPARVRSSKNTILFFSWVNLSGFLLSDARSRKASLLLPSSSWRHKMTSWWTCFLMGDPVHQETIGGNCRLCLAALPQLLGWHILTESVSHLLCSYLSVTVFFPALLACLYICPHPFAAVSALLSLLQNLAFSLSSCHSGCMQV